MPTACHPDRHPICENTTKREVGAGWFDAISVAVKGGQSATTAMADSTEAAQFTATDDNMAAE